MILSVLKTAIDQWFRHRSARLRAALPYGSVFPTGPLLLIVTSVALRRRDDEFVWLALNHKRL